MVTAAAAFLWVLGLLAVDSAAGLTPTAAYMPALLAYAGLLLYIWRPQAVAGPVGCIQSPAGCSLRGFPAPLWAATQTDAEPTVIVVRLPLRPQWPEFRHRLCHQLLGSHTSPFPGEIPFGYCVCPPWPAPSGPLRAHGTSDTFSATHWQGWAVRVSASGGIRAFFASVMNPARSIVVDQATPVHRRIIS